MDGYNGNKIRAAIDANGGINDVSVALSRKKIATKPTLYKICRSDEDVKLKTLRGVLEYLGLTWKDVFI